MRNWSFFSAANFFHNFYNIKLIRILEIEIVLFLIAFIRKRDNSTSIIGMAFASI